MINEGISEKFVSLERCNSVLIQHIRCLSCPEDQDLYFNQIPIQRLRDYCGVERIIIELDYSDNLDLHINHYYLDGRYESKPLGIKEHFAEIEISEGAFISISGDPNANVINQTLAVYAVSDNCNEVRMAHVVCTYHREKEVEKKINLFSAFNESDYHLFIIDNGCTIPERSEGGVSIIHSPNYGGSSGFARGIIESLRNRFTHVILNDDDARMDPESVFRVIAFCRLVKPEYRDVCIAGICLDSDDYYVVYDAGGTFDGISVLQPKRGVDTAHMDGIVSLYGDYQIGYSNWAFACFPSDSIRTNGFPLPLFIWYDDVEFGIRKGMRFTTLPGTSVHHHNTNTGDPNPYYRLRNAVIVSLCKGGFDRKTLKSIIHSLATEISAYRYQFAEDMVVAIEDVLKGPDYVFYLCKQGMHRMRIEPDGNLEELRSKMDMVASIPHIDFYRRLLSMNGLFLSTLGDIEADIYDLDSSHFYRVQNVLYHLKDGKGFIAQRNRSRIIKLTIKTLILSLKLRLFSSKIKNEYQSSLSKYTTEEFWSELFTSTKRNRL